MFSVCVVIINNISLAVMPRLCAFKCSPTDSSTHRFPNPDKFPERFETWVALVGGKLETASDYEYYKRKRVCDKHFTDQDHNRNNRLNALAIPSLHLSGFHSSTSISSQIEHSHSLPRMGINECQPKPDVTKPDQDIKVSLNRKFNEEMPQPVSFSWQEEGELVLEADLKPDFFEEHLIDSEEFSWPSKENLKPETEDKSDAHPAEPTDTDCHLGYHCNTCLAQIMGFRYVCVQCLDWDLCGACEARGEHPHHYVLRIPAQRPRDEVRATLRTIRRILADDIIHLSNTVPEIKEEEESLEDPIEVDRSHETVHTTAPHPKRKSTETELNTSFEQECSSSDREESQSDRDESESNMDLAERPAFVDESSVDVAEIDSLTDFNRGVAEVPSVTAIDTRPRNQPMSAPRSLPFSTTCERTLPHTKKFKIISTLVDNFKQQGAVGIPDRSPVRALPATPTAEKKPLKVIRIQRNTLTRIPPTVRIPLKKAVVVVEKLNKTAIHAHKPRPPPDIHIPGTHTLVSGQPSQGVQNERKRRKKFADAFAIVVKQQRTRHLAIDRDTHK